MDISESRAHDAEMTPYKSYGDLDAVHAALLTDAKAWRVSDTRWLVARAELASIAAQIVERAKYEQSRLGRPAYS